jgi:heme/copper-type cytochrome/quinol oxidase subunit 2
MTFRFADVLFWLAAACCAIGHLAILRSVVMARGGADQQSERRHRVVEIVWAVLPGIALAVVLTFTWRAMHSHVHVMHMAPASVASAAR